MAHQIQIQALPPRRGRARFDRYLYQLAQKAPRMGIYPDLPSQPFHDPTPIPLCATLEAAFSDIRREALALPPGDFHRETEAIERAGDWDVYLLHEHPRTALPTLGRLIEGGTIQTLAGLCYISRLRPGAHVAPHKGPVNTRLRCHLGIQIPQGDCAIRVGSEVRRWEEGRCLVLDDSYEHEAWNHTSQARLVLVVDLWHPDLTEEEIALLEGLRRYVNAQALVQAGYWAGNAAAQKDQQVKGGTSAT